MDKILLIDGSGLLFQSFYGMPNKIINKHGQNVEAVICFTGILLKTIKLINPSKLLIVFDGENTLNRKEIDNDYKANRPNFSETAEDETPFPQLEIIKQVLTHLNFSFIETTNQEADDYIASFVNKYKNDNKIIISSSDKDFYQLIDENVSVFCYRGKVSKLWNQKEILNKYGFDAKYFSTFKALVGDPSDNIKGIAGIGEKTAEKLIKHYGSLENIIKSSSLNTDKTSILISSNIDKLMQNFSIIDLTKVENETKLKEELIFTTPLKSSIEIVKEINIL